MQSGPISGNFQQLDALFGNFFPKADKLGIYWSTVRVCRCGAKQDNRPGRQNRLGKKGIAKVIASFLSVKSLICRFYWEETAFFSGSPIRRHGSDFIYTKNSARPRSDFLYTKNAPPPKADFLYTHSFGAFVRFCKWKKASIYWITESFDPKSKRVRNRFTGIFS